VPPSCGKMAMWSFNTPSCETHWEGQLIMG
jgi:hypothetical protein